MYQDEQFFLIYVNSNILTCNDLFANFQKSSKILFSFFHKISKNIQQYKKIA